MKPNNFSESNKTLRKPHSMTDEECNSLHIYNDGTVCVSQWQASWFERLSILFHGRVWLRVLSGETQPPVCIQTMYPFKR